MGNWRLEVGGGGEWMGGGLGSDDRGLLRKRLSNSQGWKSRASEDSQVLAFSCRLVVAREEPQSLSLSAGHSQGSTLTTAVLGFNPH